MTYLNELFKRYIAGRCTEEELSVLLRHFELEQYSEELDTLIAEELAKDADPQDVAPELDDIVANNREALRTRIREQQPEKPFLRTLRVALPWAGVALFVSAIAFYLNMRPMAPTSNPQTQDISAGTNRAVITLSDGNAIELSEDHQAVVIDKGAIAYKDGDKIAQADGIQYAVLTTPRAGQYQLELPDGTAVWLNAESSIRYPLSFDGDTRRVEMTGEAYFEVTHTVNEYGERVPFIVESAGQQVEVLGTRFNIQSYADEFATYTTLAEGSVRVYASGAREGRILVPGELASVNDGHIDVQPADIESITAWTRGDFVFNQEDLNSVLKKIARWYDVEIIYPDTVPDIRFSGAIARSRNLSAVLQMMEMTGEVTFEIQGRRVVVMH